jgi:hypothetical protein
MRVLHELFLAFMLADANNKKSFSLSQLTSNKPSVAKETMKNIISITSKRFDSEFRGEMRQKRLHHTYDTDTSVAQTRLKRAR